MTGPLLLRNAPADFPEDPQGLHPPASLGVQTPAGFLVSTCRLGLQPCTPALSPGSRPLAPRGEGFFKTVSFLLFSQE